MEFGKAASTLMPTARITTAEPSGIAFSALSGLVASAKLGTLAVVSKVAVLADLVNALGASPLRCTLRSRHLGTSRQPGGSDRPRR